MSTTTTNYGLIKPDTTDPILVGQLNDNADVIDATLKSLSDALDVAKLGIKYKGEVNYYSNLPSSGNQIGDAYTVKYAGSSGTTPDGTEYVWGTVSGTNQWINFSKDSYTKAEVDALLALKQNALTTAQLAAANSGIDSAKVEQIETNKNNISLLTAKANQIGLKLVKSQTVASNTEVTYTMNKNDFIESSPDINGSIGTYIISVMPWSTAPIFSLYSVSYTGGSFSYTSIVKIAGADRTVTVSSGIISVSGFPSAGAKVSIHAML